MAARSDQSSSQYWRAPPPHADSRTFEDPWTRAFKAFTAEIRSRVPLILMTGLLVAALAGAVRFKLPLVHKSTAQVLVDPRGFRFLSNELQGGPFDANAAINFVESQMVIIKSDRVLLRVVREEKLAEMLADGFVGQLAETRALNALQRSIFVERGERSFIINVTAANSEPAVAARLANAVVKAYLDADAVDRSARAKTLKSDFEGRLNALRESLLEAERNVENFRVLNGLVGMTEIGSLDLQLRNTIQQLSEVQEREIQAQAGLKQLENAPNALDALGSLPRGSDQASQGLAMRIAGLMKARADVVELSGILGDRHPALLDARTKLGSLENDIAETLSDLRSAANSALERARSEAAALKNQATELADKLTKARGADVELRALARDVEGRKNIFQAFQARYREASEFGEIDSSNMRIVSPARPPVDRRPLPGIVLWAVLGGIIGVLLAMSGLAWGLLRTIDSRNVPTSP